MRKISPKAKTQSRRPPLIAALTNWWFCYNEDLIKAVESEDETEMLHALEKGAYVNTKNAKGLTPLFIAVAVLYAVTNFSKYLFPDLSKIID